MWEETEQKLSISVPDKLSSREVIDIDLLNKGPGSFGKIDKN